MLRKLVLACLLSVIASTPGVLAAAPDPGLAPTGQPGAPLPGEATVCARTSSGRRLACVYVASDGDRTPDGSVCTFDDALGLLGWSVDDEVVCLETTEEWGYVSGAGVCERTFGSDEPQACVNGRRQCLLWAVGVRVVCDVSGDG